MTSYFKLLGSWEAVPGTSGTSGDPDIPCPFDERVLLSRKHYDEIGLAADGFTAVGLGGLVSVHVLIVKTDGKVVLRLTSTDGTQQTIPVEEFLAMTSTTTPFTAIDMKRTPGTLTNARIFLGEKL